jgi:hypothetical protein
VLACVMLGRAVPTRRLTRSRSRLPYVLWGVALYLLIWYFAFRFGGDGGKNGARISG